MSCTVHVSGTLVVLSEQAVFIWGMLPTPCSMGQLLRTSPRDGESLVKMEVSEFPGEMEVQVHTLQLSVLKAIYYTDHAICACLGKKVWLALGKNILFFPFFLTSKRTLCK